MFNQLSTIMAPMAKIGEQAGKDHAERIDDIDVSEEMRGSFLEYAYSVIYARALPDARDGLKPVQRRILFQMQQMGLTSDRGYVKSQRVVGEVMGKLHPHGDTAIYDALVRLAQDFNLRLPLVDGHGNFGSLDDGPAAARYTEARLAPSAALLTATLDEDTVDFVPNYDNQFMQPEVLPAAFPSLLVNGASGIAVGMATQIPPHNPGETIRAALHLLDHPDAEVEELMRIVPGPDFPEGGIIPGLDGVRQAYATGRGTFKIRAKVSVERTSARRMGLVITELPYMVGPERVIERIKDGVNSGKLKGIANVTNLTDRHHGLRLIIDVKSGFDPHQVLGLLYKHTPLEESFGINAVSLVEGQPKTLSLKEMLEVFLGHRLDVTRRQAQFQFDKKKSRLHLVEGLLLAVLDIDDVIAIIRSSENAEEARGRLMTAFDLSEIQAQHILELRLRRLTKFSKLELETEQSELLAQIDELGQLLGSPTLLKARVAADLEEVARFLASPRRTLLLDEAPVEAAATNAGSLEIPDEPCIVVLTPDGLLARIAGDQPPSPPNEGGDLWTSWVATTARGTVRVVTEDGTAHAVQAETLPALARSDFAQSLAGAIPFADLAGVKESPVGVFVPEPSDKRGEEVPLLILGTRQGVVKRVRAAQAPNRDTWPVITLEGDDRVVGTSNGAETDFAVFITKSGQLLKFPVDSVRPQGLPAGGVAGIKLAEGDEVIFFGAVNETPEASVLTVSEPTGALPGTVPGRGKISLLTQFPAKGRATMGVRAQRMLSGEGSLSIAWAGPHGPKAVGAAGTEVPLPEEPERRDASGTPLNAPVAAVG